MTHRGVRSLLRSAVRPLATGQLLRVPADIPGLNEPVREVFGIELKEAGVGSAVAALAVGTAHLNTRGAVQGGVLATLADAAAGWAVDLTEKVGDFATVQLNANLVGACVEGDQLHASARTVHAGRRTCVCAVEVSRLRVGQTAPRLVATFQCTQLLTE